MNRSPPGDGITQIKLSFEPLATEGEATPGPDDVNPYETGEFTHQEREPFFGPDLLAEPPEPDFVAHDDTEGISDTRGDFEPLQDGFLEVELW